MNSISFIQFAKLRSEVKSCWNTSSALRQGRVCTS